MNTLLKIALLCVMLAGLTACGAPSYNMAPMAPQGQASYKATQALRAAYSQVGKPYVLGGKSPAQGFDCSGLIYWAYGVNGVAVPRRTTEQLNAGYRVSGAPLPGDIVVFRINSTSLHTGLYAGGNTFIHSPRQGARVRTESLTTPYWSNKLVSIRRVS